jgi:hypothetical protein
MVARIARILLLVVMVLNGLLFIVNISVLGDRQAAIEMHEDLAPNASALAANGKVLVCFVTGILYLVGAYGLWRKQPRLIVAGILGFLLFDGAYLVELISWADRADVWIGFGLFGGLSFVFGLVSWRDWRRSTLQPV